ncbi:hypothetical protein ACMYR3_10805 [Ampullimonas aquatilis]|uniref:hypothetical protein n=1 Tax=Ampullimonas aquatilis TaxID=1341549 RepID=UPI003C75EAE6
MKSNPKKQQQNLQIKSPLRLELRLQIRRQLIHQFERHRNALMTVVDTISQGMIGQSSMQCRRLFATIVFSHRFFSQMG